MGSGGGGGGGVVGYGVQGWNPWRRGLPLNDTKRSEGDHSVE